MLGRTPSGALSQPLKAVMPLHGICDPTAAFAFSLSPSFVVSLFRSPAIKSFTLAPSLRWRRWRRSRADLYRKSRPWLYLDLGLRWLHADGDPEEKCGKRANCGSHDNFFQLLIHAHQTIDGIVLV